MMVLSTMVALATIAGEWIGGGATAFEKDFAVADGVTSASLAVTGLGYYEAYLDGRKIGDRVLEPSPTGKPGDCPHSRQGWIRPRLTASETASARVETSRRV